MGRNSDGVAKIKARAKVPLKTILDERLVYALSHLVRGHAFSVLNERIASPKEVACEIGVEVSYVSYHFEQLERKGLIELVKTEPKRGAVEHFYRAKASLFFDDREWARLPAWLKESMDADLFQSILDDVIRAFKAGTFNRDDRHLSWTTFPLDKRGWSDLSAALAGTLERVRAIQAESAERLQRTGEEAMPTTVAIVGFELPPDPVAREVNAVAAG